MSLFTADELADLQAEQLASMPDTCTITRSQQVSDNAGGTTSARTTIATVPCRYGPESRRAVVVVVAGRIVAVAHWTFTFPIGTDVQNGDLLTVGTRIWEAVGVLSPDSYQLATRVRAQEQE